ncbi:hypothetical protein TMS3_0116365 [Pseudomonas taeanensis MS-3]|uniref:Uncharacterized protein n=1 Tax=Pseudomonas taeanensis MS-3 TaxID=1395571 RepID=A0A0A1YK72_9PSED|nr:hypothetical protein TMS3_0116365 [Pseudomonas taeanensis MS-3]
MRSSNDYALRGACYEIQKTLDAMWGPCEVGVSVQVLRREWVFEGRVPPRLPQSIVVGTMRPLTVEQRSSRN